MARGAILAQHDRMETNTIRALNTQPVNTLIIFMQQAILLLRAAEEDMSRNGLKHWYSSRDLERALQGINGNKSELVELVDLVYRDPYVQMLQARENAIELGHVLNNSSRSPSPVENSERSSPVTLLNGYSPKSNISRYNSLLKGGKRRSRRSRSSRSRSSSRR